MMTIRRYGTTCGSLQLLFPYVIACHHTYIQLLYISHAISQFAELSWQFSMTLFLAAMTHFESLFLVSSYGLISWCCLLLFGAAMARFFVDTISWNRRKALNLLIVAENVAVIAGCLVSYEIFQRDDEYVIHQQQHQPHAHYWMRTVLLTILFTSGSIGMVLQQTMVVVLERDWLIVVAQHMQATAANAGDSDSLGGEMNVVVRQIDLACKVLTPAFAGGLIGWLQHGASDNIRALRQAALVMAVLNAIAMVVEILFMTRLYHLVPGLATRHHHQSEKQQVAVDDGKPAGDNNKSAQKSTTSTIAITSETTSMFYGVRIYFQQPVAAAGVALSFLYFNALTFGGIMTAYLLSRGMSMSSVGLWRGLSAISGLCGTFVYRHLRQRFSLVTVGFVSILYQCVILSIGVVTLYLPTTLLSFSTAMTLLVGTVITSRIGLYGFDIAVTQLMQEQIPAPIRGVIGGTQQSLNAACQIASFVLSMAYQNPKDFPTYATIGYFGTVVATILFGGRMLHFQPPPPAASKSEHSLEETTT
jgi:solute carrier family 40 (iron-regulated transporter), member 1